MLVNELPVCKLRHRIGTNTKSVLPKAIKSGNWREVPYPTHKQTLFLVIFPAKSFCYFGTQKFDYQIGNRGDFKEAHFSLMTLTATYRLHIECRLCALEIPTRKVPLDENSCRSFERSFQPEIFRSNWTPDRTNKTIVSKIQKKLCTWTACSSTN